MPDFNTTAEKKLKPYGPFVLDTMMAHREKIRNSFRHSPSLIRAPRIFLYFIAAFGFFTPAQATTLEQKIANTLGRDFSSNEERLAEISRELKTLPTPHLRVPTGTGGYLSQGQKSPSKEDVIKFSWVDSVKLDAVAFFPLRLFMNNTYSENLHWPGTITIEAIIDGQPKTIAHRTNLQPLVRQSLPILVEFDPITTRELIIRCTDLSPQKGSYATGFAEICIFSGTDNVAPRASNRNASSSRQGYHVLAKEFLTDSQTPLGIPELSQGSLANNFVKKLGWGRRQKNKPYILELTWDEEITMDAIRIDPAIQHAYLKSFPVRFTIQLLDAQGNIVHTDNTHRNFPLKAPGLNPWFCYFPVTSAQTVRLIVLAASQPVPRANQAIAFSEITAVYQGKNHAPPTTFTEAFLNKKLTLTQDTPRDTPERQVLASASDGLTQSGKILPLRQWIKGLALRQALLEEQVTLRKAQQKTLTKVRRGMIQGSLLLLIIVPGSALYFVIRNRNRSRREIRATRVQIASDLHDDVGSNLGAIILHVERLQEQTDTPPEPKRLEAIYRLTRESVFGLREVLNTTTPEVGRSQNLVAYMEELAGLILGRTEYVFEADPGMTEKPMAHTLRKGLLLFYKEALHNAKRHSNCTLVNISLRHRKNAITLRVKDNGKGIAQEVLNRKQTLRTLKQRAEFLKADLQIETESKIGTTLTLTTK